jgi:hypothetical protein
VSLHQQLLDAVRPPAGTPLSDLDPNSWLAALRAVVELHAPVFNFEGSQIPNCRGCDKPRTARRPPWPCRTVQAIARELGIEATDHG